jgi:tRNA(fMet)-specific endonuclease VapC
MIRYLLDTSVCVELLRGRLPHVRARARLVPIDEIAVSTISLAELLYGAAKSSNPARHETILAEFLAPIAILLFDMDAAKAYARVRADLTKVGQPIGPLDMLIAAHALSVGAAVVTANEREFRRVPGLTVENWLAS